MKRSSAYIILSPIRLFLTVLLSACMTVSVIAQDFFFEDTITISAVTVTARGHDRMSPLGRTTVDSVTLVRYAGSDLAAVLHESGPFPVRRYGNFGLSTISMRGLTGSHAAITWNGLSLSGSATGMADLTLIPVSAASSVSFIKGGADLIDITGSIGGRIDMTSEPACTDGASLSGAISAGSYGDYRSSVSLSGGKGNLAASLSAFATVAENDFVFINENAPGGPSTGHRTNSSARIYGLTNDITYMMERSSLNTHLWYNSSSRELPGPVTTVEVNNNEKQEDRAMRAVASYTFKGDRFYASLSSGENFEHNTYENPVMDISGDNRSLVWMTMGRIGFYTGEKTELTLNAGNEYQEARSLSFDGHGTRNIFSASFSANYCPSPRVKITGQARKMFVSSSEVPLDATAGAAFMLTRNRSNIVKVNFTRNSRLPGLNDIYWIPGGNPDLKPETARASELSYVFASSGKNNPRTDIEVTFHISDVDDFIQWVPGPGGLWSAMNVRSVLVAGAEGSAGTRFVYPDGSLRLSADYAFTRSVISSSDMHNDKSVGKQLIYTPLHHLGGDVSGTWHILTGGVNAVAESRRYTTSDNSEWLPASLIINCEAGTSFRLSHACFTATVAVDNILSSSYESIRNYPMPLRTFQIRLTVSTLPKPENIKKY